MKYRFYYINSTNKLELWLFRNIYMFQLKKAAYHTRYAVFLFAICLFCSQLPDLMISIPFCGTYVYN